MILIRVMLLFVIALLSVVLFRLAQEYLHRKKGCQCDGSSVGQI